MNKFTFGAAALVLTGAAAAAVPAYLGWQTQQQFTAALNNLAANANSPVAVTLVKYERGWLHSSATHRVTLKADPDVHFDVQHRIRQVPDPSRGFVVIESTPHWPQKVQAAADYYFGGKPAFSVQTVKRFDRSVAMSFDSPAFSKPMIAQPERKLSWGGASGTMSAADGGKVDVQLDLPRIALEGGGLTAEFAGMAVRGDWFMAGNQADWSGRTDLGIREISVTSPIANASLKGVETRVVQRSQGETVLLGYTLKVKEGAAQKQGEALQSFRQAVLDVEFDRLDRKALARYFDDVAGADRAQLAPDTHNRLVGHLALGMFADLLKGSPEMRVKQLAVQTENGQVSGSAVLAFNGKGFVAQPGAQASPAELMSRVRFTGSAELSSTLLQAWMVGDARAQALSMLAAQGAHFEESQLQTLAQEMVRQQLAQLEASGLLKAEGDKFVIRAEYSGGALTVNGVRNDAFLPPLAPPAAAPAQKDDQQA
jgi:uncharacterized protein YdgA (DUF945 family)